MLIFLRIIFFIFNPSSERFFIKLDKAFLKTFFIKTLLVFIFCSDLIIPGTSFRSEKFISYEFKASMDFIVRSKFLRASLST